MYKLIELQNGLRVALENIDYVNSVSVGLWVENGSRNEDKINNGISHFIEHMLFKGTENRTSLQIVECIEEVGGQINAFTGKEATCFYGKVLDSHLELLIEVLSDMLFNSKFNSEDIEKEKGVIIEEINMNEDSPEDVLMDLQCEAIWGEDSISLPILGTIDTVKSFTREQIIKYVKSFYIPENSVISIAGKFNADEIVKLIERYFGNWNSKIKKITHYSSPEILSNHLFKKKNIEQLHISLGIPGIESGKDEIYPLLLLNNIFGGGASSILFQKIREEKGMCYSIYSYLSTFKNTGALSIYTGLNPSYCKDVILLIKEEVDKFINSAISDEKLIKAKEQLKGNYILGLESTSSRMFSNGKSALFLNLIHTPKDIIDKIDKIDMKCISDIKEITFAKGIRNSAFVGENADIESVKNILDESREGFTQSKAYSV